MKKNNNKKDTIVVPTKLIFNYIVELRKKDVHPVERAEIIKAYMKEENLTGRALAKEIGVPHSTLQDWLDYSKLSHASYDNLISSGSVTKKELHRILRKERTNANIADDLKRKNELNLKIQQAIVDLRDYINNPEWTESTIRLIAELRNVLNRIEIHIEQKMKGK